MLEAHLRKSCTMIDHSYPGSSCHSCFVQSSQALASQSSLITPEGLQFMSLIELRSSRVAHGRSLEGEVSSHLTVAVGDYSFTYLYRLRVAFQVSYSGEAEGRRGDLRPDGQSSVQPGGFGICKQCEASPPVRADLTYVLWPPVSQLMFARGLYGFPHISARKTAAHRCSCIVHAGLSRF